ncbi:MAG TPA: hypothetical protein VEY95_14425 [Azospirillaceae bacterium]|nr:hypothetical protein [Azospirillaceae bacterium]
MFGWTPTLVALAAAVSILVFAERRARRPFDPLRPSLVPWNLVILVAGSACVLLLAHVVSLGTGTPLVGRGVP